MAESISSESCCGTQRDIPEQQQSSDSISPVSPTEVSVVSTDSVSFPKEEQEDEETSPKKKVKCSSIPVPYKDQEVLSSAALSASSSEIDFGNSERTDMFDEEMQTIERIDERKSFSQSVDGELLEDGGKGDSSGSVVEKKESSSDSERGGNKIQNSECRLEVEKKRLLAELENVTAFSKKNHLEIIAGFSNFFKIDKKGDGFQVQQKPAESDELKSDGLCGDHTFVGGSLKFEVVDDTALIDMIALENKENGRLKNQDVALSNRKTDGENQIDGKQTKKSRRKRNGKEKTVKMVEEHRNFAAQVSEFCNAGRKDNNQNKVVYSRQELEAMRFVKTDEQKTLWGKIYGGLALEVANEYNNLACLKNQRNLGLKFDRRQQILRMEQDQSILGPVAGLGRAPLNVFVG